MQLDKRINDIGVILTCFSIEAAKEYLGQQGYFTNTIDDYQNLEKFTDFRTLVRVDDDGTPFVAGDLCYPFFLPAEFVRPAETKKWRPFTLEEFRARFSLLSPVTYRWKKGDRSFTMCVTGYEVSDGREYVILGGRYYGFCELVCENELQDKDGNWTPFGVVEWKNNVR